MRNRRCESHGVTRGKTTLLSGLMALTVVGCSGGGGGEPEVARPSQPLAEDASYRDLTEVADALAAAGAQCQELRQTAPEVAGCSLDGGESSDVTIYSEPLGAYNRRLSDLAGNRFMCSPDVGAGREGLYLAGRDWMILDTAGAHLRAIAQQVQRQAEPLCGEGEALAGPGDDSATEVAEGEELPLPGVEKSPANLRACRSAGLMETVWGQDLQLAADGGGAALPELKISLIRQTALYPFDGADSPTGDIGVVAERLASLEGEMSDAYMPETTARLLIALSQELLQGCINMGVSGAELMAVPLPPALEAFAN